MDKSSSPFGSAGAASVASVFFYFYFWQCLIVLMAESRAFIFEMSKREEGSSELSASACRSKLLQMVCDQVGVGYPV